MGLAEAYGRSIAPVNEAASIPAAGGSHEKSSNFYLGFLFLSERRREALAAVYAFCRHVDDIVDDVDQPEEEARKQLADWRTEIAALYDGRPAHPIAKRLAPYVLEFDLPKEGFLELINGMEMDLDKKRYKSIEDLEKYLFGAAGSVGLLCVKVFGYKHTSEERIREYAIEMGNAMQLTNILRDVGADLEMGRVYLPTADIEEAGSSLEELYQRKHTPAFTHLMEREWERAKSYFNRARNLLDPRDRANMLPADVMARVYEDLLDRIREERYRVFFQKVRVPGWRKVYLAASAWMASRF
jgi:phytoene synthase